MVVVEAEMAEGWNGWNGAGGWGVGGPEGGGNDGGEGGGERLLFLCVGSFLSLNLSKRFWISKLFPWVVGAPFKSLASTFFLTSKSLQWDSKHQMLRCPQKLIQKGFLF